MILRFVQRFMDMTHMPDMNKAMAPFMRQRVKEKQAERRGREFSWDDIMLACEEATWSEPFEQFASPSYLIYLLLGSHP